MSTTSRATTLQSHAKFNLALQIVSRRPDGFHELRTIFQRLDLCDEITFQSLPNDVIELTSNCPGLPCDERNLVYRVAKMLKESLDIKLGVKIHIRKCIPVAAGLAGGSSNAATALQGLNIIWRLNLSHSRLLRYAKSIGSDVAFFLYDCSFALGTGRGEIIQPLNIPHTYWFVLITPKAPLLTKDVYQLYAERYAPKVFPADKLGMARLTKGRDDVSMLARSLKKNDILAVQQGLFNDLAGPIVTLRPSLLKLKKRLEKYHPAGVCFSGSGPSIFVLTRSRAQAENIACRFRRTYKQVFVVRTA